MFELFSESARRVIFFARYGAVTIGGSEIDSELLLWALAREAPLLLEEAGAPGLDQTIATDHASPEKASTEGDVPLGRDAHAALIQATREAKRMGSPFVTPAHLLLGLLADHQSTAGARLRRLGVVAEQVRALAREARTWKRVDRPVGGDFPPQP